MARPLNNTDVILIHEAAMKRRAHEAAVAITKTYAKKSLSKETRKELTDGLTTIIVAALGF